MLLVLSSLVIARYRSLSLVVICVSVSFESDGGVNDRDDSLRSPFTPTGSPSVSLHAKNIRSAYYNPTSFSLTSHSLAALASSLTSSDTWFSKLPSFSDQDQ